MHAAVTCLNMLLKTICPDNEYEIMKNGKRAKCYDDIDDRVISDILLPISICFSFFFFIVKILCYVFDKKKFAVLSLLSVSCSTDWLTKHDRK